MRITWAALSALLFLACSATRHSTVDQRDVQQDQEHMETEDDCKSCKRQKAFVDKMLAQSRKEYDELRIKYKKLKQKYAELYDELKAQLEDDDSEDDFIFARK